MAAAVISISSKVPALAALFVVLAMSAEAASPNGGWLAAKATWYGAPNGAGPDDNGTCVPASHAHGGCHYQCPCACLTLLCLQVARVGSRTPTSTRTCP